MNIHIQIKEKCEFISPPLFIQTYWLLTLLLTTALYKKTSFFCPILFITGREKNSRKYEMVVRLGQRFMEAGKSFLHYIKVFFATPLCIPHLNQH